MFLYLVKVQTFQIIQKMQKCNACPDNKKYLNQTKNNGVPNNGHLNNGQNQSHKQNRDHITCIIH